MRIVYVLTSLGRGGAEHQALAVADRMTRRGHTVALLVLCPPVDGQWPTDLRVVHLGMHKTPASLLAGLVEARRFLLEFHPDLLHSHSFHANIVARLVKLFVPFVAVLSTVHNVYEGPWPRMMAYRLTDGLARCTTAVSQAAANRFVRLKAVPQQKCIVLPNGIDIAEFAPSAERRAQTRASMGASTEFIWLAAGRIVPAKDYPNLLRAFAQVRASRSCSEADAQLWIAGEASAAQASTLQTLAVELSLNDSLRWLDLRRDLPALFDAADAFVLASAWEGMPLAAGEAMAMEKPVIATNAGGTRELVGNAGVIVPVKAPDALAAAMLELMEQSPEARQAMGRAARERIAADFSMDTTADAWEHLYRCVLNPES